jgi:hypothetical protein
MPEETTYTFTKKEMDKRAIDFMIATFGKASESEDKDKWYARLGLLMDFISTNYPD